MEETHIRKAEAYKAEAKKKATPGWFSGGKWDEAAELYVQAANAYKMGKNMEGASEAFVLAAEMHLKVPSKYEAATNYINASNCIKKANKDASLNYMKKAVDLFGEEGKFSIAARHVKEMAEMLEAEMNIEQAAEYFQMAADYYEGEGSTSAASQCLIKVATFDALLNKFDRAIELFEKIASESVNDNLRKWGAKELFLKAGLCHLANEDIVSAKKAIQKYVDLDPTFDRTREHKLLEDCVAAVEEFDAAKFTAACQEFDSITRLDSWKTAILLKVKNTIKEADDSSLA